MRFVVLWVVTVALAALSRWVAAPAVRGWADAEISAHDSGTPPIAAIVIGPWAGGVLEWLIPLMLLFGAGSVTVSWMKARIRRRR